MKSNGQDALELAELGLYVFPLHTWVVDHCSCNDALCGTVSDKGETIGSPAKHPRTMNGFKDASADIAQVIEWWSRWPSANVGVRTGAESGVVVLDIDPRHGGDETWVPMMEEYNYQHSGPICTTGGGGLHLYFEHPGTSVKSQSEGIGKGLDVRGDGGYVVAPPSIHRTGTAYCWAETYAPWEREYPAIPPWLLLKMETRIGGDKHGAPPIGERVTKGGRNAALLSLGGTMRHRGFGETAIFNALMAENDEKCEPPLDAREVAKVAKSLMRYAPDTSGPLIIDTERAGKKGAERREEAYAPTPRTLAELQGRELLPTQWAVHDFLPQGVAMCAGAAKLGKSWMMLGLCIAIAQGDDAMTYLPTVEGDCLYLALEDGERRLQNRTLSLLGEAAWPGRTWYETKWPRIDEGGKEALEAWLGQHPEARLVVIDTFVLFKPLDAGKSAKDIYAADYASVRAVKAIADEYGVCILLVTHLNKGEHADWVNGMTGSTGLSGSADTLLNLARPDGVRDVGNKNEATLRLTGRDVEEQAWACTRDRQGWWKITGDAAEVGEQRSNNETVNYMQMLWQDGYQEVTAKLMRLVCNKQTPTLNRELARTASNGLIQRLRQGVYALNDSDRIGLGKDTIMVGKG